MKIQDLRSTLSTIHEQFPERCVANDDQLLDFKIKLRDLIEDTNYNIDIVDLYTALHCAIEDFEMYA